MTNAATLAAVAASGFRRNRIQNGDFRVDQRNNYGWVALTASNSAYATDRWQVSKGNTTQNITGGGASGQLLYQIDVGAAPAAGEASQIVHQIEGSDMADLGWGAAGARPVTLSFLVYTSTPGLYCFSITNLGNSRSFVGSFTVNAANTFEKKVITIPGDTTGTWGGTAADKWQLRFDMGTGTTFTTATPGWNAGNFVRVASAVQLITTAGRYFYLREVQLEAGSVATPFEWLPIREQLANCQRWYRKLRFLTAGYGNAAQNLSVDALISPTMRATPAGTIANIGGGGAGVAGFTFLSATSFRTAISLTATGYAWSDDNITLDCEGT